jgi:hypothetical protein
VFFVNSNGRFFILWLLTILSNAFFRELYLSYCSDEKGENSGLNDRYSVLMKNTVMGDNGEALYLCLCDEHSVKGVTVVRREVSNSVSMVGRDGKLLKGLSLQNLAKIGGYS